ncbi:MAG: ComF family protein [Rickettsiales bacterium]|nr:ComF family protein [Rickettsiales bacterium]
MFKFFTKFINLIFPPKCLLCGKIVEEYNTLCHDCWHNIQFIQKPFCNKCSTPLQLRISDNDLCGNCLKNPPLYTKSRSAIAYNEETAKIIFKFKFYDKPHIKKFMAKTMIKASQDILNNIDILIPIPLHKKRLIFRKYNQALLLANEIGKLSNKKVIYNFLLKKKHTTPQAKLKEVERAKNLKDKFCINSKYLKNIRNYKNLNFAIIDDVMTTGSTINECVKILNKVGIKNVYAITFAKTVRN